MGSATRTVKVWFNCRFADYVVDDTDREFIFLFFMAQSVSIMILH